MKSRLIIILLVLVLLYMFFVWRGLRLKYRIPQVSKLLSGLGYEENLGSTFELFQIGIGLKTA